MTKRMALAAAAIGALAAAGHAEAADAKGHLSMGVFPALRPLELVRQQGWLEKAGYDVEWHDFIQGIPPEAAAMAAGSIDFGEADTSGIEQVAAKSPDVMWYIANGATNYVALVARKDSGIKTVADLKGRRVGGVIPNTAPTAVLEMALVKSGLSLKDVQGFNMAGPSEPAALERGAVDAVITYVPYSAETLTSGTADLVTTASDIYGKTWLGGGVIVRPAFAQQHPETVADVLRAVAQADALLRDHPEQAYEALAAVSKTSLENVKYAYAHNLVAPAPLLPDKAQMVEQTKILIEHHVIDVPDPAKFIDGLVHPEFAAKVAGG